MAAQSRTQTQLVRNLARLPQEMIDAMWVQYMYTHGVHVFEYHYAQEEELGPKVIQRRKELADIRHNITSQSVHPVWGPAPQIEEDRSWGNGYTTEILTVPLVNTEFRAASRYMRDRVVDQISASMREQLDMLRRIEEKSMTPAPAVDLSVNDLSVDDFSVNDLGVNDLSVNAKPAPEVDLNVYAKPDGYYDRVRAMLRPKEDLVLLLRPLQGFGLARFPGVSKWATPYPAEHLISDEGLIHHKYPEFGHAQALAMVFDPAVYRRNCHGCKLLDLHYQGMQDEERRHRQVKHVRDALGIKPACRMCEAVQTRLVWLADADKTPDRLASTTRKIRDELLQARRRTLNLVPDDEKRRRAGCDIDPTTHSIRDFGVHHTAMEPLPDSPGDLDWPWRCPDTPEARTHASASTGFEDPTYDPTTDDDTVSLCSVDLDHSSFTRYNNSDRKQLIDATPIRYTHDHSLILFNRDPAYLHCDAPPRVRSLPITQPTLLDLHPSSFHLPPASDPNNPTLRQFHDKLTPLPRHGSHPQCHNQPVVPYDTDLVRPHFLQEAGQFPKCKTLYMVDYAIALRPGVTTIPMEGKAFWNDDNGGMYVEVDPEDNRWVIERAGDGPRLGDVVELVEYVQYCWDAEQAVHWASATQEQALDPESGEWSERKQLRRIAVMAYVRLEDFGRWKGLMPGGGIGDGVGLPREERVRMRVERDRKGQPARTYRYVKEEDYLWDFVQTANYHHEFRGVVNELDPNRWTQPEYWYQEDEPCCLPDEEEEEEKEEEE